MDGTKTLIIKQNNQEIFSRFHFIVIGILNIVDRFRADVVFAVVFGCARNIVKTQVVILYPIARLVKENFCKLRMAGDDKVIGF